MSVFEESLSYRPFKYPFAVEAEKKQFIDTYWHEGQVDLQDDLRQYLSKDGLKTANCTHEYNKYLLDTSLLFFTQLDMNVAQGYVELLQETKNNEIKTLLIQHAAKEVRHQRAYALAGETFGFTDSDWNAFRQYQEMVNKIDVMTFSSAPLSTPFGYALKLTQVLLGEGIGLFAQFTTLLNFKRFGMLIGFNDINQWSLLDEFLHVENNIAVLKQVIIDLSQEEVADLIVATKALVEDFVEAEHRVIDLYYEKGSQEGIDKEDFKNYIRYLGKNLLFKMGYIGSIEVPNNPLKWMDSMLSAERHGAFFEKRVTDYSHKKLEGEIDYKKYQILLDS